MTFKKEHTEQVTPRPYRAEPVVEGHIEPDGSVVVDKDSDDPKDESPSSDSTSQSGDTESSDENVPVNDIPVDGDFENPIVE